MSELVEKQGAILGRIREGLMGLADMAPAEVDEFFGMWWDCVQAGGMEEIMNQATIQTILNDRSRGWAAVVGDPLGVVGGLEEREQLLGRSAFARILLFVMQRVLWDSAGSGGAVGGGEVCRRMLRWAQKFDQTRVYYLRFINQQFIEDPGLVVELINSANIRLDFLPFIVEYIPSTHILIDTLPSDDVFTMHLGAYLAIKYPLPKTLDLCRNMVKRMGGEVVMTGAEKLEICLLLMRAFPILMAEVMPIMSVFANDPAFTVASRAAVQEINRITMAVKEPIYKRGPLV